MNETQQNLKNNQLLKKLRKELNGIYRAQHCASSMLALVVEFTNDFYTSVALYLSDGDFCDIFVLDRLKVFCNLTIKATELEPENSLSITNIISKSHKFLEMAERIQAKEEVLNPVERDIAETCENILNSLESIKSNIWSLILCYEKCIHDLKDNELVFNKALIYCEDNMNNRNNGIDYLDKFNLLKNQIADVYIAN